MPNRSALMRFTMTPENRAALVAVQGVLSELAEAPGRSSHVFQACPLFLHGPSGTGKTHLIRILREEADALDRTVCMLNANDFAESGAFEIPEEAREFDLLIVEDLHHLPARFVESLVQLLDFRQSYARQTVVTALYGPAQLGHRGESFPRRLTSRLGAGLVVGIDPWSTPSRRLLLEEFSRIAQVTIATEALDWLAKHLTGGGRQLDGAVKQIKALTRLRKKPLSVAEVQQHFRAEVEAITPTVERITEHVGACYQIPSRQLRSAQRTRTVMLPRQISMYLARRLTSLTLEQIGSYFGNRDHKTVHHACKKVESAIKSDRMLSGIVNRLHAELA